MKTLLQSCLAGLAFLLVCGFIYPVLITGVGQLIFNFQANGSIVKVDGKEVGSKLIGQDFEDVRFFHGRVSAVNYDTRPANSSEALVLASGSQNLAVSNPKLAERIKKDMDDFLKNHPNLAAKDLPANLFTSSFSGLDPDIDLLSANVQVDGISAATGLDKSKIEQIIRDNTTSRSLGIFGTERLNVLEANIAIYKLINSK